MLIFRYSLILQSWWTKWKSHLIDTINLKLLSKYFRVNPTVMDERSFWTTKYSYNMMHHILLRFEFRYSGQILENVDIEFDIGKQRNYLDITSSLKSKWFHMFNDNKINNAESILSFWFICFQYFIIITTIPAK